MSSRARALKLSVIATCALVACKPAPTPASDAADAAPAAAATSAAPDQPSMLARTAGELNPLPDPKAAIKASMDRFMAVRSYHATMDFAGGPGGTMGHHEIDFVAPDRFRMQTPMGTQVIIGDTMYMHVRGRTMQVPMPKGALTQWRDPARLAQAEAGMTVQAQGSDTVDGVAARKYRVHHQQPRPMDVLMWINGDGLPVRIQVSSLMQGRNLTSTTDYSRFNDPTIRVDAK